MVEKQEGFPFCFLNQKKGEKNEMVFFVGAGVYRRVSRSSCPTGC
jgi:hypothetical protein